MFNKVKWPFALFAIPLFGSTYCCEQFFSKIKHCKGKQRGHLSDEHLKSQLRIACCSVKVNITKAGKDVQQQNHIKLD